VRRRWLGKTAETDGVLADWKRTKDQQIQVAQESTSKSQVDLYDIELMDAAGGDEGSLMVNLEYLEESGSTVVPDER
jgi:hypothetical protein